MAGEPRIGAFVVAGDKRLGIWSDVMVTPAAARPEVDATSGLTIFQEVLGSLLHEASVDQTLNLISRRVTELAAFDFCGIVLPDADWSHVHLAASYAFPPRYARRLQDTFLAPLQGT